MDDAEGPRHGTGGERRAARCPVCSTPTTPATRPFCSARCKEIDLGRWLTGSYVIAGGRTDEDGETTGEATATSPSRDDDGNDDEPRR